MAEAIGKLPQGTWQASMRIDGYEAPIDLWATLTIGGDTICVDYTGTSGMSSYAINCPLCYTEAYTTFGVNCVVAPHIPNNAGTLDAVRVTAPQGTILSARSIPLRSMRARRWGTCCPTWCMAVWTRRCRDACRRRGRRICGP